MILMNIKKYLYETAKYVLRSYPIIRPYIKEVERMYAMGNEELSRRNEMRFLEIFRRAYDKSPFYNRLYTNAGIRKEDITCLADIKKLPVVTKDMVKQNANDILTVPLWKVVAANTSGTTGTPLRIYESWPSIWRSQAYTYCTRKRNGFTYGQKLVSLRGHLDRKTTFLRVHISNTLYLSSYNINQQNIRKYYDLIKNFNPVAIEGYPSSLYSLALFMKEADLKLHIPVTFTSSETLFNYQRVLIQGRLGTEVYDNYGMTEQTIYLQEAYNHQGYYEMPGYSINEYLNNGEICTSLVNEAFPLIRYRSNDVMEITETTEENTQIVVKRVGGQENCISCNDGMRIMHLAFLFNGVKHVKMSQLVQNKNGLLEVRVVPENGFDEENKNQIVQNLIARVGNGNIDYRIRLINEKDMICDLERDFKYLADLMFVKPKKMLRGIIGRVDDYVVCKDGTMVTRIDFVENGKHIKACQWVQDEKGKVMILVVPDVGFTEADASFVKEATLERIGYDNMDIDFRLVAIDDLIYTDRGKFKLIVNRMN